MNRDYEEAMNAINHAVYVAARKANAAISAADNQDGAPVDEWRKIANRLKDIAADVDSLIDHGCTVQQMAALRAEYEANKPGEYDAEGMEMRLREMRGLE